MGNRRSRGPIGSALDNGAAEAVNSAIKVELVHGTRFATRARRRQVIGGCWTSGFSNTDVGTAPAAACHPSRTST
jgi:hypothetical protein